MSEVFKKLKLHEPLRRVQFRFLKNSQVQIYFKLNEKNRMITYTNSLTETCSLGFLCTSLILDIHVMIN